MDIYKEIFEKTGIFFDVFDRMQDEIFIYDKNCCLQYKNKAAERAEGSRLSSEKGKSAYELYDFVNDIDERTSPMMIALREERPVNNIPFHYYVNGRVLTKIVSSSPIYHHGELVGTYTIQRDNTMVEENIRLQKELQKATIKNSKSKKVSDPFLDIIGEHSQFNYCIAQAKQSASTNSSVILIGSTGCGKEVLARAIHQSSQREKFPFLTLNCAAIPENLIESLLFGTTKGVYTGAVEKEGLLQEANGGTVFLDEINSMPLAAQAKLLRVLEDKKIMKLGDNKEISLDIRIISSINQQPLSAIQEGRIREDLYYRLSVVSILLPTLKERREDIPKLTDYFIKKYNERFSKNISGIEDEVMDLFMKYPWPGNIRQLKSCIESAMNFCDKEGTLSVREMPQYLLTYESKNLETQRKKSDIISSQSPKAEQDIFSNYELKSKHEEEEKDVIIRVLLECEGNISRAAKKLGISHQLLHYRIKKYKLK